MIIRNNLRGKHCAGIMRMVPGPVRKGIRRNTIPGRDYDDPRSCGDGPYARPFTVTGNNPVRFLKKFSDTSENGSHKQGKRRFSSLMSSNIERIASISGRILPYGGSLPDWYGQLIPADLR